MGCNDDENEDNHTKSNDTTKNKNGVTVNPPEVAVTYFFTLLRSMPKSPVASLFSGGFFVHPRPRSALD